MSTWLSLPTTLRLFLIFSPPFPGGKTRHMLIEIAAQLQKKEKKKRWISGFCRPCFPQRECDTRLFTSRKLSGDTKAI